VWVLVGLARPYNTHEEKRAAREGTSVHVASGLSHQYVSLTANR